MSVHSDYHEEKLNIIKMKNGFHITASKSMLPGDHIYGGDLYLYVSSQDTQVLKRDFICGLLYNRTCIVFAHRNYGAFLNTGKLGLHMESRSLHWSHDYRE